MLSIAVIGVGNRGRKYLDYLLSHPKGFEVAALVDPSPLHLDVAARRFGVPPQRLFHSAESFFALGKMADAVLICSPDRDHYSQAMEAMSLGYHVLMEKPAAQSREECRSLLDAASRQGRLLCGCYVLRFHPLYGKMRDLIREIGPVKRVSHRIRIGKDRMSHTFVRGPWGSSAETSPIFLSKCCHDVDILLWMTELHPEETASEGSLSFFREDHAPSGSALRCTDCSLQDTCPYSAVDMYAKRRSWTDSFLPQPGQTKEDAIAWELKAGRYGRCVWHCDNDVADRQTVWIRTREGAQISLEMDGLSLEEGRWTRVEGLGGTVSTDGRILTLDKEGTKTVFDFSFLLSLPYHAGADFALLEDFFRGMTDSSHHPLSSLSDSVDSLFVCFDAEEKRKNPYL